MDEKYERAVFILTKIAKWESEYHGMDEATSFKCCKNMAKQFLRYIELEEKTEKESNVIRCENVWNKDGK